MDVINVWQWGQFILLNSLKPVVVFQCFSIHGIHFLNSKVSQPYMENLILLWLLKMIPLCSAHFSTPCEFDFLRVTMTLSTHCKTYHQNWKALMFIWEPKPLRWTCWGVHVSCLQFKLHIWVLTQIWDLSDCYIHFYYTISYILKIQGQSIINFW